MINLQTKNRILSLYKGRPHSYDKVTKEEYRKLLYAVRPYLTLDKGEWIDSVSLFLLRGASAFDRFMWPRPAYVDGNSYKIFCDFIEALEKLGEGIRNHRAIFQLDKIRWKIFKECSLETLSDEQENILNKCEDELNSLKVDGVNKELMDGFAQTKSKTQSLIDDIRKGRIKTLIHTSLPFKLTNTDATFAIKVNGVNVRVNLVNHSQGSSLPGVDIADGTTLAVSGPSRWTTTICELTIEANCLIDGIELRPNITLQKTEDD